MLARLDLSGRPHRNPPPDGTKLECPHLHLFREGEYSWAFPVPVNDFPNLDDLWLTLFDFMKYCHIIDPPRIVRGKQA